MCDPCCGPCDPCYSCYPSCLPKPCKSRELRGGLLISNCECLKRNGLQHDCPRTLCQGKPCCLTKPEANCCPSQWARRYRYVTMGKKSNPVRPSLRCCLPTGGGGCNPCPIDPTCCVPANICDPCCPPVCDPCIPTGCDPCCPPVCDPSYPPVCDPSCSVPYYTLKRIRSAVRQPTPRPKMAKTNWYCPPWRPIRRVPLPCHFQAPCKAHCYNVDRFCYPLTRCCAGRW
ncbi:keratin-associated protein 16-1-like [Anopheles ziemanni]|uniref:keratin-associated protein 16-1-like n=1 Tax=Anopheles ziemanni TaxID=345580 RepID=UPI00265F1B9B|nr:keratin-associated protein 16-1-like [Anopheles ziemanni]